MILHLKTVDSRQELRDFFCLLDSIESCFDILNGIVRNGDSLIEACIIEDQKTTKLPINAFQGESFSVSIQELQQEWEDILNRPIGNLTPKHERELILLTHQKIEILRARHTLYNKTINWFEDFSKQVENDYLYEPWRSKIISNCQEKITSYQSKLALSLIACKLLEKRYQKPYIE